MFDVGFSELVLILVIGLLVLGPERLPGAVRTAGLWIARLRRSFNDIRADIEREVRLDEIKRDIHNQTILDSLKETGDELGKLRDLPYDIGSIGRPASRPTNDASATLPPTGEAPPPVADDAPPAPRPAAAPATSSSPSQESRP
jgi:sec-independent protein translocase protein TatB